MKAGRMTDRIRICPPTNAQNSAGETVQTYNLANSFAVFATVRPQGDAERLRNGINCPESTYAIRVYFRSDITDDCQITYRSRVLDVYSVLPDAGREWLDIVAQERAA